MGIGICFHEKCLGKFSITDHRASDAQVGVCIVQVLSPVLTVRHQNWDTTQSGTLQVASPLAALW